MTPIKSFLDMKNKFGKPGAYVIAAMALMASLTIPLLIGGLFFLAGKFFLWSLSTLFTW